MTDPKPPKDSINADRREVVGLAMAAGAAAGLGLAGAAQAAPLAAAARPERIYIHETFNVTVRQRRDYLDFMCRRAVAANKAHGKSRAFGVWATNGSTHRWAETVQMWERQDLAAMAAGWEHEFNYLITDDRSGDPWNTYWAKGAEGVADVDGMDRLLVAADYSPTMEELVARGVKGPGYLQQTVTTPTGGIHDFLQRLGTQGVPAVEALGLKFVGAYRTLLVSDNEGVVLWAMPTYPAWAAYERARLTDPRMQDWMADCGRRGVAWDGKHLVASACNPLNTGLI
jgi:hypothetical protein